MEKKIIFVRGSANPEYLQEELDHYGEALAALRQSGCDVATVGNPQTGFTLTQFRRALTACPEADTIIIHAHGNEFHEKHYIAARPWREKDRYRERIWAHDLYRVIADTRCEAQNVFMLSCGSASGCAQAVQYLPFGSTLASFVDERDIYHKRNEARAFNIPKVPGHSFAENLFLSLLCGNQNNGHNSGVLTIATADRSPKTIWSLWDAARLNSFDGVCDADTESSLIEQLAPYATAKAVTAAIATIELYYKYLTLPNIEDPRTDIKLRPLIDNEAYRHSASRHHVLGIMCAIGYLMNKEEFGAFQSWPPARYEQITPPRSQSDSKYSALLSGLAL